MANLILKPNAVGYHSIGSGSPWDTSTSATMWEALSTYDPTGDGSFGYADIPGPFTVKFEDTALRSHFRPERISDVKVLAKVRVFGIYPTSFKFLIRLWDKDYYSEVYTLDPSAEYVEVLHTFREAPTGTSWTATSINDAEFGLVYVEGGELRCTTLTAHVNTEIYPDQTLRPTRESYDSEHRQWDVNPEEASVSGSLGTYDGGSSYIRSQDSWDLMVSSTSNTLRNVFGFDENSIFAVGNNGTILYWNGEFWDPLDSGTSLDLYGVWGSAANDVYAIGLSGTLLHWDAIEWSVVDLGGLDKHLYGITGTGASDILVVGEDGTALKYDGVTWTQLAPGITYDFNRAWADSASDYYIVGRTGTVVHYDGGIPGTWTTMPTGVTKHLYDVWGTSTTNIYVVGDDGTLLHYTGAWSTISVDTTEDLRGITGEGNDYIIAGENGTVIVSVGGVISRRELGSDLDFYSVWGTLSTKIVVVGEGGAVYDHIGSSWIPLHAFVVDPIELPASHPPTIDRIKISCLVKNTGQTIARVSPVVRSFGVDYLGSCSRLGVQIPPDDSWHLIEDIFVNDPDDGWPCGLSSGYPPWTNDKFDHVQLSGTVETVNGVTTIQGTGTAFTTEVTPGKAWIVGPSGKANHVEIASVTDDVTLDLSLPYDGSSSENLLMYLGSGLEFGVQNLDGSLECTSLAVEVFNRFAPYSLDLLLPRDPSLSEERNSLEDLSTIVPGGGEKPWENVDDTPPPDGDTSYNGGDAEAAGTILYGTYKTGPAIGSFVSGEQSMFLETTASVRLNDDEDPAKIAPILYFPVLEVGRGTVAASNGSPGLTGTGTKFLNDFVPGSIVVIEDSGSAQRTYRVASITTGVNLLLDENYGGASEGGLTYYVLNGLTHFGREVSINETGSSWFDVKQEFVVSPFTGNPWTADEIDRVESGIAILDGEAYVTAVNSSSYTMGAYLDTAPGEPDDPSLVITDDALNWMQRSIDEGIIYAVTEFGLTEDGYDPAQPYVVINADPATSISAPDYALPGEVFRDRVTDVTTGKDGSWNYSHVPPTFILTHQKVTYWCRVPPGEAISCIGEIGLYAEVLYSPVPAEIGEKFLFALMHFPARCRHLRSVDLFKVTIRYPL